jgi:hypothetical protein
MIMINPKFCEKCINFNSDNNTCGAFPYGIPVDILSGKIKHTVRFPEQVGTDVFEDRLEFLKSGGIDVTHMEQRDDIEYEEN